MADNESKNFDSEIDTFLQRIVEGVTKSQDEWEVDNVDDFFDEYISSSMQYGLKDGKKVGYFPCDTCKKKQAIINQYNKICNKEYIPPYIDDDCRDYKIALVIERIEDAVVEKAFRYFVFRVSIKEILQMIDDPEWRRQAEDILISTGYYNFIDQQLGKLNKKTIMQLLFDLNYAYFDILNKRNLTKTEVAFMTKYYIILTLRDRIKEGLFKIARLMELELEYKIAVVEGEIRYFLKCILQEILVTPVPAANYNITYFNKIGGLTELLKLFNAHEGKHDERADFRHIRDTVRKYEKLVRSTLDILNKKIKQYEDLIGQRKFIVGITGICGEANNLGHDPRDKHSVVVPPKPIIVLNPPTKNGSQ